MLLAGLVFLAIVIFDFVDGQFRIKNISDQTLSRENITSLSMEERLFVHQILDQPFSYLDRGRQSYVFESQDGRYVLKFFDLRRYKPGWSTLFSRSSQSRMERKRARLLKGYQFAFEQDRENAVIIFQQLAYNPDMDQQVDVIDRYGFRHSIDLSLVPFIIQKKGKPTRQVISEYLDKGDVENVKKLLRLLLNMYHEEYGRGVYDRDHNFMYNTGFIEEQPIRLDVGRLRAEESYKDPEVAKKDLEKIVDDRAGGWLQRHYPRYREEIISDLRVKLNELYP